jgi:hypothetical protein
MTHILEGDQLFTCFHLFIFDQQEMKSCCRTMLMGAIVAFMALCGTANAQQSTVFRPAGSDGTDVASYELAKQQFIHEHPEMFIGQTATVKAAATAKSADFGYDAQKEAAGLAKASQHKARITAMDQAGLLSVDRNQLNERERGKYDAKVAEIDAQFPKD